MKPVVACFAIAAALLAAPALAAQVRPLQGNVIMAKSTPAAALYVWNATPYVTQLVGDKLLGDPGMRAIEATALKALVAKAKGVHATELSIHVLYEKTGAVSPVYGTPTFMGMEKVATLRATRKRLLASGASWVDAVAAGTTPPGLTVEVTGKLPPPQ